MNLKVEISSNKPMALAVWSPSVINIVSTPLISVYFSLTFSKEENQYDHQVSTNLYKCKTLRFFFFEYL